MSFVKSLAKGGLFGLAGLAASGAFNKHKNKKPEPSLIAQDTTGTSRPTINPSLINKSSLY